MIKTKVKGLWANKNYHSIEDCDYDHSLHKSTLVLRTATTIAALFLRITIMITVLIKCTIYEDRDHGHCRHKNVMFLSLYMIATMIAIFFIRAAIMIAVFIKMSYM